MDERHDEMLAQSRSKDLNRRNLLRGSALIGAGQALAPGAAAQQGGPADAGAGRSRITKSEVLAKARERLYPTCRVCQVCDGVACSGDGGGIAGAGTGMS